MQLGDCIERYLTVMSIHLAASSVKTYTSRLHYLQRALGPDQPLDRITLTKLEKIIATYRKTHSANTTALAVTAIKQFFLWCVDVELLSTSPAHKLRSPKREQKIPRPLSHEQAHRLIDQAYHRMESDNWLEVRNAVLVLFMVQTGLRRAEVAHLKWKDIELDDQHLIVQGKGSKERRVPLFSGLIQPLRRLQEIQGRTYGAVFAKEDGTPLHVYTLNMIFRRWVVGALNVNATPHQLRHTFATMLIEKGASLDEVRDLLGHTSIATTQIYVATSPERLRSAIERLG
jgi:integrase/recombinase XerC